MILRKIIGIAVIALPSILFAQKDITVTESPKEMSLGTQNAYVLTIPEAKTKDINDDWQKQVKKDTKGKVEDIKGEVKTTLITVKNISQVPLTIYSRILETKEGIQLSAWFVEGDSFISTTLSADKSAAVQKYLHDFGVQEYKVIAQKQLDEELKKQKDLQKIYDGFVKDQTKADKAVTDAQKDIVKLQEKNKDEEGNIKQAQADKGANNATANQQKNTDAEQKHAKELQKIIKDQQNAENNIKSNTKRIEKLQDKIKEETSNSEKAKSNQGPAQSNVDAQKTQVAAAQDKLKNIK